MYSKLLNYKGNTAFSISKSYLLRKVRIIR